MSSECCAPGIALLSHKAGGHKLLPFMLAEAISRRWVDVVRVHCLDHA